MNDPTLMKHINLNDQFDRELLDLINKGLVEYAISDETGELMLTLTELGKETCKELFGEENGNF